MRLTRRPAVRYTILFLALFIGCTSDSTAPVNNTPDPDPQPTVWPPFTRQDVLEVTWETGNATTDLFSITELTARTEGGNVVAGRLRAVSSKHSILHDFRSSTEAAQFQIFVSNTADCRDWSPPRTIEWSGQVKWNRSSASGDINSFTICGDGSTIEFQGAGQGTWTVLVK